MVGQGSAMPARRARALGRFARVNGVVLAMAVAVIPLGLGAELAGF